MKDLKIKFQDTMRYATAGDYVGDDIMVFNQINDDYNFLIAIHEFVEKYLTEREGIKETDILAWDLTCKDDEPGANPDAPYYHQHLQAEIIERMLAAMMHIDWIKYEQEIKVYEQS